MSEKVLWKCVLYCSNNKNYCLTTQPNRSYILWAQNIKLAEGLGDYLEYFYFWLKLSGISIWVIEWLHYCDLWLVMGQDGVVFLQFSFKWIDNAKLAEILASTEKEKKKKKKKNTWEAMMFNKFQLGLVTNICHRIYLANMGHAI